MMQARAQPSSMQTMGGIKPLTFVLSRHSVENETDAQGNVIKKDMLEDVPSMKLTTF